MLYKEIVDTGRGRGRIIGFVLEEKLRDKIEVTLDSLFSMFKRKMEQSHTLKLHS